MSAKTYLNVNSVNIKLGEVDPGDQRQGDSQQSKANKTAEILVKPSGVKPKQTAAGEVHRGDSDEDKAKPPVE